MDESVNCILLVCVSFKTVLGEICRRENDIEIAAGVEVILRGGFEEVYIHK